MGQPPVAVAVADAGPLIHLAEVGMLRVLKCIGQLLIPEMVWAETVGAGRVRADEVMGKTGMQRTPIQSAELVQFVSQHSLQHLHAGECEALCLCARVACTTLLTDDLAVRDAAKTLNITPVGSLGLIILAFRTGILTRLDAEQALFNLFDISSLFVTRALVDQAVEEIRKTAPP